MNKAHQLIDWTQRAERAVLKVENLIGGRLQASSSGHVIRKASPRNGAPLYEYQSATPADVDQAVAVAQRAFADGRWSKLTSSKRREALNRLSQKILENAEDLALLETLDVGKPIGDSLGFDVPHAAAVFASHAANAERVSSTVYGNDAWSLSYQLRRPLGVIAGIIGWNFPLVLAAEKIAPALAAGNSVILKPSDLTPLTATKLAQLALEAGIPDGVLSIVNGAGSVGATLAQHPQVNLVSFTGSSATGKRLMISAGQSNMKRLLLECGGKAPNIVFEDAPNLQSVADAIVARAFWNQGQVCTASSRLLVHESVKDELIRRVVDRATRLEPGDPLKPDTVFGALVSAAHRDKVLGYVNSATQEGLPVAYRSESKSPNREGFYVAPIIFDKVEANHRIAQEEIFGPVLAVMSFRDEEEAIHIANSTVYGLSAILWTTHIGRAHRVVQAIDAGWVVVNATDRPQGGPGASIVSIGGHKQSGIGVEGGMEGLLNYTSSTAVQIYS